MLQTSEFSILMPTILFDTLKSKKKSILGLKILVMLNQYWIYKQKGKKKLV